MKKSILLPTLVSSMVLVLSACGGGSSDSGERPVPDTEAPVITIIGGDIEINQNDVYNDAGATAEDNIDETVTVTIANGVNSSIVGVHSVIYTAVDVAGNESTATRRVTVKDVTPPIISVIGGTATVVEGDTYNDAGANAIDTVDGGVAVFATSVDTSEAGTKTITYTAFDAAGNSAVAARTVKVIRPASFSQFDGTWRGNCLSTSVLPGATTATQEFSIEAGKLINIVKAYATDDCTGDLVYNATAEADVTFGGPVNTSVCVAEKVDSDITLATINDEEQDRSNIQDFITQTGYPVFNLFCLNNNGKLLGGRLSTGDGLSEANRPTEMASSATAKYAKVDTIVPNIILVGSDNITIDEGTTYVDAGANATDDQDGDLDVIVTGDVVTSASVPDTYEIIYTASDAEGNTTTAKRIVNVIRPANSFTAFDGEWSSECISNSNPALAAVGVRAVHKLYTISDDVNTALLNGYRASNCSGEPDYLGLAEVHIVYRGEIDVDVSTCSSGKAEKVDLNVTEASINNAPSLGIDDTKTFMEATEFPVFNLLCLDANGDLREGNVAGELNGLKESKRPNEMDMTGAGLKLKTF